MKRNRSFTLLSLVAFLAITPFVGCFAAPESDSFDDEAGSENVGEADDAVASPPVGGPIVIGDPEPGDSDDGWIETTKSCTSNSQCNDGNPCTADKCGLNQHRCRNKPLVAGTTCGAATFCGGQPVCNGAGTCQLDGPDSYDTCGFSCSAGYHPTAYDCDYACSGSCTIAHNHASCAPDCGQTLQTCVLCPAGYHEIGSYTAAECGTANNGFGTRRTCQRNP